MPLNIPLNLSRLEQVSTNYSTPFYIYDKELIKSNAKKYMTTFTHYFPTFTQYFAVKALPNPSILKILKKCGMGFDCSSPEEIKIVQLMDYMTDKQSSPIMYTSNYTSQSDLSVVLSNKNIKDNIIINLDDFDGFTNMILTRQKLPDTICFRYNPILSNKTDIKPDIKSNNFSGTDTKFGMSKSYLFEAYKLAKQHGIKHFGIHVMSQSNCLDIDFWKTLIDDIFDIIFELYVTLKITIEFIDIGGGIGIPYKPNESEIDLEKVVLLIRDRFNYNIQKYNMKYEPQLMTECGRYITGPYGWLVSRCTSIKETDNGKFYGLDANMAHLMRPGMYNAYHHITIPRLENNKTKKVNVVGTLCENNDWFCKQRELPKGIKKNDLFVMHDCGAHAYSMGFNYNSKLHCPELLLTKNGVKQIRKREDIDYHLQNTKMYDDINNYELLYCIILIFICLCIWFFIK
jgi:diaminopimelate decarboxylase